MKASEINKRLFWVLLISIGIFLLSLLFSNDTRSMAAAIDSAILNSSHKNDVDTIEILKKDASREKIRLEKHGDFWLLIKSDENPKNEELCTFADKKIVASLLETSSKVRKIYKISDDDDDFFRLGLGDDNGVLIVFSKKDGSEFSKVHFGKENTLKNRIYIRSESQKIVYETENNFSQYLNVDADYWAEGAIFPEIENLVQISFTGEKSFVLDEKSPSFSDLSHKILSLRHGKIESSGVLNPDFARPFSYLVVQDGNSRIVKLEFFEKYENKDENLESEETEKSFFYRKTVIPSEIDSQDNIFAFYSQNSLYEISSWTYDNLTQKAD